MTQWQTGADGHEYPRSLVEQEGTRYSLLKGRQDGHRRLVIEGDSRGFAGESVGDRLVAPLTAGNARALRERLSWLNPRPLGRQTSFGFGDRLGTATAGHIAALRAAGAAAVVAPIFAQQSVRENARTGRTPREVLDDAMWGVFQEGWTAPWGADADHVKETGDLPPFIEAGYTFFTIDPSDYVNNEAQTASLDTLRAMAGQLPWTQLGTSNAALELEYCAGPIELGHLTLTFDEETLLRALVKYGPAILHTAALSWFLAGKIPGGAFDLEMSVDETDTPTSIYEHYFIARELLRRDVPVTSLALRFVGKFQKGVDYIGDTAEFASQLASHVAVRQHFDRYKISIHTGSDKFSLYGIIHELAGGHVHVKTAGTSYLEALRAVAAREPALFRAMLELAHERFAHDRHSYFLDCRPENVPLSTELTDGQLPALLEQFDARQLLHVTYGSILDAFGADLEAFGVAHEEAYRAALEQHLARHLRPFVP